MGRKACLNYPTLQITQTVKSVLSKQKHPTNIGGVFLFAVTASIKNL
jgi:hypothetical protein